MGKDAALMIDAGNSKQHVKMYQHLITELSLPLPTSCVVTHWHWDHTFGIHALNCDSYAHPLTNEMLDTMSSWTWTDQAMIERVERGSEIEFADQHMREEYEDVEQIKVIQADYSLRDRQQFDLGGITAECIHLSSAHSDDSIVVFIPEERILFIGDIYGDDYYHNHTRDLEKTRQLIHGLNLIDFDVAIPGHGEPLEKDRLMQILNRFVTSSR